MKNQYFGDNKDLFKYDLVWQIIHAGLVDHFMFIPMLTENDGKGDGEDRNRSKAKAGSKNSALVTFLDKFEDRSKRDINKLKIFFKKQSIETVIFRDYFYHAERERYFQEVKKRLRLKSLIFVDPDKGLEIKRTRDEHIKYGEVKSLYERMDKSSILMIFQYFPRENHEKYLSWRPEDLKDKIDGDPPIYIYDKKIIFFFLTKENVFLRDLLGKVISKYGEDYGLSVMIN